MKNGCPECKKLADDKLCDVCELGLFQATVEAALADFAAKANEMLAERKVKNAKCE